MRSNVIKLIYRAFEACTVISFEPLVKVVTQRIVYYTESTEVALAAANVLYERATFQETSKRSRSKLQHPTYKKRMVDELHDTQTGMLSGIPESAMCVQRFDDSLNSAIHITYRISLRSSSMREPRDPLLKVVYLFDIS